MKQIGAYLRQSGPMDHGLACTHAALNQLTPEQLPNDLTGRALFIDEAHHASADGLAQLVTLWRERGGQLFFFTATPYRGDGRQVRLEGMRTFRRSLAEHMAEGFAPRHLESEIVALGQPGDAITGGQFTGEEAPPSSYFEALIAAIGRRWVEDGKPKTIVRVPPMKGGKSGELVNRLLQTLAAQGARVLDATGTDGGTKAILGRPGRREEPDLCRIGIRCHGGHSAGAGGDGLAGVQCGLLCGDAGVAEYRGAVPGPGDATQGRGLSSRTAGSGQAGLFVPCGGGAALADLSIDHSRHALLTCCFLADHEVGEEWIVLRRCAGD